MTYMQFESNGIVTFKRSGEGVPLLVIPGVMADALGWMPVGDAIDARNPVIIVNRRGRSPSRAVGPDYGVPVEIADIAEVVAAIGEPVHLFGWSYGGLVAMEAAVAGLPVRSVIAYEPVSRPFAPETIQPIRDAVALADFDCAVEIINRDVSGFDSAYVDALRKSPAWPELCRLAAPLGEELAAIDLFDPSYQRYASLEIPIELILGESNQGRRPYGTAFDRFARATPQASISLLAGQGHLAHVSNPAALADLIARAIERVG
jgi:pimeloyl-ACP methyl ester carboxylesterase